MTRYFISTKIKMQHYKIDKPIHICTYMYIFNFYLFINLQKEERDLEFYFIIFKVERSK